jgi:uncharacterized protein involved in exopolysaccharide biosynthesis
MFKANDNPSLNNISLLHLFFKWWKPLGVVAAAAVVLSTLLSGPAFIQPQYSASSVFFPARYPNSLSKPLLSPTSTKDLLEFGEEVQAEQILQILNSNEIRNRIIAKYNLMQHYGIDPGSPKAQDLLSKTYEGNVSFRRTELMSIRVDVTDTDPQMAADMANDIVALVDTVKNKIQKKAAMQALAIVEKTYKEKLKRMQEQEDSLNRLRARGLYDYRYQARVLTKAMLKAGPTEAANIRKQLSILATYGGAFINLTELLKLTRAELVILETQYEKAKVDANEQIPAVFVVNTAVNDPHKVYPVRWVIVAVSLLFSLAAAVAVILAIEYRKHRSASGEQAH